MSAAAVCLLSDTKKNGSPLALKGTARTVKSFTVALQKESYPLWLWNARNNIRIGEQRQAMKDRKPCAVRQFMVLTRLSAGGNDSKYEVSLGVCAPGAIVAWRSAPMRDFFLAERVMR